jgi:enoyl-CoA hydratase/carnithine racemase
MPVEYEKKDRAGWVTLSRPGARNAWGPDFYDGVAKYFDEMEADDDVHCAVLTGDEAGGAFSAGANLKDPKTHRTGSAADFLKGLARKREVSPFDRLADFPKPVIAAVNGYAVGIGCIITFCCDLIVASERAEWRLPQVALGILPAYGGSARLARWIGKGLAMRVAMGFPLSAEEAHRVGLAQWLVPHDELVAKTTEVAAHIAAMPPLSARMVKESITHGLDVANIKDASLTDLYRFMMLELTEDTQEAHQAWRDKRDPVFKGE